VDSFRVEGEIPERARGAAEYHAIGDHRGLLRQWAYDRAPHDWDRTDRGPATLAELRECVERLRAEGELPADTAALARAAEAMNEWPCLAPLAWWFRERELESSIDPLRFSYERVDDGYRLTARPRRYLETALRSYLLTPENAVHVTLDDRPATPRDPRLPDCLPHDVGDCVPTPADAPPRVAFLHEDVVDAQRPFELRVRVAGDTTRVPTGIMWVWNCNVPADDSALPVPLDQFHGAQLSDYGCASLRDTPLPLRDRVVVRVWLRSAGGTIAWQQDTIRVVNRPGR
jgi:hypothetical protein